MNPGSVNPGSIDPGSIDSGHPAPAPWHQLVAASPLGVVVHDHQGRVVQANASFAHLLGYELADVYQLTVDDIIYPADRPARDALAARMTAGEIDQAVVDRRLLHRDGQPISVRSYKSAITVGDSSMVMVLIQDVREWRLRLDQLSYAATHDELTGLLNRAGLTAEMEHLLDTGRSGRLAVIDLNGLKAVNDRYGHAAGDTVLRVTADLLEKPGPDGRLVARLGGDEFVVVDRTGSNDLRADLLSTLEVDVVLMEGVTVTLSASVGEAPFGRGDLLDEILHEADREMYQHKRRRGSGRLAHVTGSQDADNAIWL